MTDCNLGIFLNFNLFLTWQLCVKMYPCCGELGLCVPIANVFSRVRANSTDVNRTSKFCILMTHIKELAATCSARPYIAYHRTRWAAGESLSYWTVINNAWCRRGVSAILTSSINKSAYLLIYFKLNQIKFINSKGPVGH